MEASKDTADDEYMRMRSSMLELIDLGRAHQLRTHKQLSQKIEHGYTKQVEEVGRIKISQAATLSTCVEKCATFLSTTRDNLGPLIASAGPFNVTRPARWGVTFG